MNDRFRFRAWSVREKIMIYNAEIAYDGTNYPTEWQLGENNNDGWICCFGEYINRQEDYKVMQCTGLKDENGTLIYEGDIVECFYDHFDGNFTEKKVTGVVKWGIGEWSVQNERKGDWYFLSYANYDEKHLQSDSVKVIGNIHENPELLEDK